jgi:hypothetical protein
MSQGNLKTPKPHWWRPWGDHPAYVTFNSVCLFLGLLASLITIYLFLKPTEDKNKVSASSQESKSTPKESATPTPVETPKKNVADSNSSKSPAVPKNDQPTTTDQAEKTPLSETAINESATPNPVPSKPKTNSVKRTNRRTNERPLTDYNYARPAPKPDSSCIYNGAC